MGVGHLGLPMTGMVLVDPAGQVGLVALDGLEVLLGLVARKRQHLLWGLQSSQSWVGG